MLSARDFWRIVRYYIAGVTNMVFGYAVFAALLALGFQVFAAQAMGFVIGASFNYFTYRYFAFNDSTANVRSYIVTYIANYLASVVILWLSLKVIPSPYAAGLFTTIVVSVLNYLVLKTFVFQRPREG